MLLLLFIFSFFNGYSQSDRLLDSILDNQLEYRSGKIQLEYVRKPFFEEDTIYKTQEVLFWNGECDDYLLVSNADTFVYVNKSYIKSINKSQRVACYREVTLGSTNIAPYLLFKVRKNELSKLMLDSINIVEFQGEIYQDSSQYYKYKVILPNQKNGIQNIVFYILFNTQTLELYSVESQIEYLQSVQFDRVIFLPIHRNAHEDTIIKETIEGVFNDMSTRCSDIKENSKKRKALTLDSVPQWQLPLLNGALLDSKTIKARYVLLDFWYVKCHPCLKAIPDLVEIDRLYGDSVLKIIGINIDGDSSKEKANIEQIINYFNIQYDIVIDKRKGFAKSMGIHSYPTILLIDQKTSRVLLLKEGYNNLLMNEVRNIIQ